MKEPSKNSQRSLSHKSPSLIYAKTGMTIADVDTMYWCVIRPKVSSVPRQQESPEDGFGRCLTSETASEVFNGLPSSGRRAQINHVNRTANIRGIAYNSTTPVVFRVTGITRGNARRTSAEFSILQDNLPLAVGHQHDHTSAYDLSRLQTDTHGNNIGLATARAARLWNALPDVSMCHISSCTTNDGSAGRIYVESYVQTRPSFNR